MFRDRIEAGEALAGAVRRALAGRAAFARPVVLALPRGGVPVAAPVARALGAPLDVILVRKIGAPFRPELAAGAVAVADDGVPALALNPEVARAAGLEGPALAAAERRALDEIARRRRLWRPGRPAEPLAGRGVVLVDDGVATGATARAAIAAIRARGPAAIALATPVAAPDALADLRPLVDAAICLHAPAAFVAVGAHYDDFGEVPDEAVARLLAEAAAAAATREDDMEAPRPGSEDVRRLFGDLGDARVAEVLATGATLAELEAAALALAGAADAPGEPPRPASGVVARVLDIVARDEEWEEPDRG